jgi:hypothetical protein
VLAFKTTDPPVQKVVDPRGVMLAEGLDTESVTEFDVVEQPLELVTSTE